jgi:hypothetical protein
MLHLRLLLGFIAGFCPQTSGETYLLNIPGEKTL